MKMSDFHISVNNSQRRMIFFIKIGLKLLFIHGQLPSHYVSFSARKEVKCLYMDQILGLDQNCPDFSKIMSGILHPRILTFWNSAL
jgi:hypothetical protein